MQLESFETTEVLQNGIAIGWPFSRKSGTSRLFSVYPPIDVGEAILSGELEIDPVVQNVSDLL